jgi:uncharacterized protein (DUF433 family)
MELECFFDFSDPGEIRIRGKRIAIDTVLEDYLAGASPEEIAARYRNLTLEEVYATILYYHHKEGEMDAYLGSSRLERHRAWVENQRNLSPLIKHLRQIKSLRGASRSDTAAP